MNTPPMLNFPVLRAVALAAALAGTLISAPAQTGDAGQKKDAAPTDLRQQGAAHLQTILAEPWAGEWKGAQLQEIRLVEQRRGVTFPTQLPPVWYAVIAGPDGRRGHLMWDAAGSGGLVEFALDADLQIRSANAVAISVPALQQFPVEEPEGRIASGCVPTSAASLVGWWIGNGQPAWRGTAGENDLQAVTRRLRGQLRMIRFPDKDGFTPDGRALAGAQPSELASVLRADAAAHKVPLHASLHLFSFPLLKEEITAGRPVLAGCTVRVPHKPELSWGHEIIGTGWATLAGREFVGVNDNFFPVKHAGTVRWIRTDAFSTLITVRPAAQK